VARSSVSRPPAARPAALLPASRRRLGARLRQAEPVSRWPPVRGRGHSTADPGPSHGGRFPRRPRHGSGGCPGILAKRTGSLSETACGATRSGACRCARCLVDLKELRELVHRKPGFSNQRPKGSFGQFCVVGNGEAPMRRVGVAKNDVTPVLRIPSYPTFRMP